MRAFNVKPGVTAATVREKENVQNLHEERLRACKCMFRLPATQSCQRSCLGSTGFPLFREACHICCVPPNHNNMPVNRSGHFSAANMYVRHVTVALTETLGS